MQSEKKQLVKSFKRLIEDLLDHYEEYTDEEKAQIQQLFQKTADLNTILDEYDIKREFDWTAFLEAGTHFFGSSWFAE